MCVAMYVLGAASCPWATASAVTGLAGPSSFNGPHSCGQHSEPGPAGSPFTMRGLFETTFMRSLLEVTKSGEYSRKRGGQISMKKGQQGQVGLSCSLRERLLTRHRNNG